MTDYEKQQLEKILRICNDFADSKVYELNNLAGGFSYMSDERTHMMAAYKRFSSLKRASTKDKAWERVTDQVLRIKVVADSAIFCNTPKSLDGIGVQNNGLQ